MGLTLIRTASAEVRDARPPTVGDVEAEARRRLARLGYDRCLARQTATGIGMPAAVKIKHLQIMAVALAFGGLATIPDDYRSDVYWPV